MGTRRLVPLLTLLGTLPTRTFTHRSTYGVRSIVRVSRPRGLSVAAVALVEEDSEDQPPLMEESGSFTSQSYLRSLSRVSDDGRSLLKAPQRYSSRQWRSNLISLSNCKILLAVRGQLLWQCLWALLISVVYIFKRGVPTLPALPHSLLGGVLGVLLGFRTNQSYDRFWEGRKLWGQCFNHCRCIARSSLAYIDSDRDTYSTLMRHLKAFPVALKQHLRGESEIEEFYGTLDGREINDLITADNLPLSVCTSLSMTLNTIKLDQTQSANNLLWWTLEDQVSKLTAIISDCERLVRTPVPVAYAVHTSRLLSLWVGTLPFVLVGCFNGYRRLLTMPLTALVAWALFCTEELGHIIEEPFGAAGSEADGRFEVLPLTRHAATRKAALTPPHTAVPSLWYCESLQNDLEESNLIKDRALRSMERVKQNEAKQEDGGGYGPEKSESAEVTDEEAMEIAREAISTVEAVELEQEEAREAKAKAEAAETEDAAAEASSDASPADDGPAAAASTAEAISEEVEAAVVAVEVAEERAAEATADDAKADDALVGVVEPISDWRASVAAARPPAELVAASRTAKVRRALSDEEAMQIAQEAKARVEAIYQEREAAALEALELDDDEVREAKAKADAAVSREEAAKRAWLAKLDVPGKWRR